MLGNAIDFEKNAYGCPGGYHKMNKAFSNVFITREGQAENMKVFVFEDG